MGANVSLLKLASSANDHLLFGPRDVGGVPQAEAVTIKDLFLDGNKAAQTSGSGAGIYLEDSDDEEAHWLIERVWVAGTRGPGIYLGSNRRASALRDVLVTRTGGVGVHVKSSDNELRKVKVGFAGDTSPAYAVQIGGWINRLVGCDLWSSLAGVLIEANVNGTSILGCGIDRHKQQGIKVDGGAGTVIQGCQFHSNSQQTGGGGPHPHILFAGGLGTATNSVVGNAFLPKDAGITNNVSFGIYCGPGTNPAGSGNLFVDSSSFASGPINDRSRFPNLAVPASQSVTLHGRETTITNVPIAMQELGNVDSFRTQVDLTFATNARLVAMVHTAANGGCSLHLQYWTGSGWDYVASSEGPNIGIGTTGLRVSGWVDVAAAARADVQLRLVTKTGDGAADPVIGTVQAQFR